MLLKTEYETIVAELFAQKATKRENNLVEMAALLDQVGNPHLRYPSVHIAGTNGKGQTAVKIAGGLEAAGLKVGLYTSPHIFEYTERITINGKPIPKEKVCTYYQELTKQSHFFTTTTLFAFRYFAEEDVDIAVIETGLGGAFDATNVLQPLLSVITSISFDHMDLLGDTLDEIATQKAGIIKQNTPVVLGPSAVLKPILQRAEQMQSLVYPIRKTSRFYDEENQYVATQALALLRNHFPIEESHIKQGIQRHLPCRFQQSGNVLYDAAHNPDGFLRLKEALQLHYPKETFRFVVGINRQKDWPRCVAIIEEIADSIHYMEVEAPIEPLPPAAKRTVVCGSFYTIAKAKLALGE